LNKLALILTGALIISGIAIFALLKSNSNKSDDIVRMERNYKDLEKENKTLNLSYKELNDRQAAKIKQLSDSLDIKPKHLIRYVEVKVTDSIVDTVIINTIQIDTNKYAFNKDTACFRIEGIVNTKTLPPSIELTKLAYDNEIDYIVYKQRRMWNFWFIHTRWFGKMETKLDVKSECGKSNVEDIEIIKM
jgi:hypothetical protein